MKYGKFNRSSLQRVGVEGLLIILAALPFTFFSIQAIASNASLIKYAVACFSSLCFLAAAFFLFRSQIIGKTLASVGIVSNVYTLWPVISHNPEIALLTSTSVIASLHFIFDFEIARNENAPSAGEERSLQRARWAGFTLMVISLLFFFMADTANSFAVGALMTSAFFSQILAIVWSVRQQSNFHKLACVLINFLFMTANIYLSQKGLVWLGTLATGFSMVIFLPDSSQDPESMSRWWEPLIYHPGRVTLVTFFLLCVFGTFLLILPSAANNLRISLIDAAFTSVSSVCVTGLIVLDTPNDFSNLGQFFILILIQLGGLGIMTVTSVALHAMGQRLSIKQERILSSSAATENLTLAESLLLIVKFTFFVEFAGALILTYLFLKTGLSAKEALWKGVFTAVSAFCNAGFSLQTDSLIQYQTNAAILHTVGLLIIMGGIAPAVNLSIIRFITGKQVPVASRIALTTTIVLLILGTFFFLAFEWNGALAGLSIADKFHNAWFQSVTLRTAGFNSIAIENVTGPTFIIMLCMMFIGGSPGGTAGGVKTTTLGVLAATFWACITGNEDISMQNRRILPESVFKAVTIVASGALVLLLTTLMLEITQSIGSRDIVFEATSALGTVGLSTGATSCLDSIGKIIIMFAMFAGRIGPVTLFSILGRERSSSNDNYLDAKINLT